jgi:hypothetical protein
MECIVSSDVSSLCDDARDFVRSISESQEQFCVDFDRLWRLCGYSRKDVAVRALKKIAEEGSDYCFSRGGVLQEPLTRRIIRKLDDKFHLTVGGFETFALSAPSRRGVPLLRLLVEHGLQVGGTCPVELQTCTEQALHELVARVAAKRNLAAKLNGPWKAHPVHTEYECNPAGDIWSIQSHRLMTKEATNDGYVSVYVNGMS